MDKAREKGKRKVGLGQVSELGGKANQSGSLRSPQRLAGNADGNADELLPGLQNDIVLKYIVPKLPWRIFHTALSRVSSYWRDAIQSRQVHDARARLNSLETLIVVNYMGPDRNRNYDAISLYSLRKDAWCELPEFPFYMRGIPLSWQRIALEGSLYVLEESFDGRPIPPSKGREMFVLDLVRQRGWKCCARLPEPRFEFACGVLDGKIYVLGGSYRGKKTNDCWVYDPKEDRWSSIAPMLSKWGAHHHAVAVRDELWVHSGGRKKAFYTEVYNPAKDEWACVESQHCHELAHLFAVKGKAYLITPDHIYGLEESSKSKSWTRLQLIHYERGPGQDDLPSRIVGAQAVDNELLVLVIFFVRGVHTGVILYRSEGFGTEQEALCLNVVGEHIFEYFALAPSMCPINL